jgi:phosphoglucosamine mutase
MSNLGLERFLAGIGPEALHRTQVGDRYVLEQMREHGFNVGGEQSGHMILSISPPPATAWSPRCRCSPSLVEAGPPASEVCHRLRPVPQLLKNVRFAGGKPLDAPDVQAPSPPPKPKGGSVRHRPPA